MSIRTGLGDSVGRLRLVATLFVVPIILPFYFWNKAHQEQLIAASDREWVIVWPATLNNKPARLYGREDHADGDGESVD